MDIKVILAHSSILLWDQSQTLMKTFTKEKVMSEMGTLFLIEALLLEKDTTFFFVYLYTSHLILMVKIT